MALSKTDLCNLALTRIGVSALLADVDSDETETAEKCLLYYDHVLDRLLAEAPWPFARRESALSLVEEDPTDEWAYSYRYPTDCITARRINVANDGERPPFEMANDASGELIYTDEADAVLVYTYRLTTVARFPAVFSDALAWALALDLSMPLSASENRRQLADVEAKKSLNKARATLLNEPNPRERPDSEFTQARGG